MLLDMGALLDVGCNVEVSWESKNVYMLYKLLMISQIVSVLTDNLLAQRSSFYSGS